MFVKSLKGYFLIAASSTVSDMFSSSVVYICEHNDKGAMGVIINRPSKLTLGEVLDDLDIAENELDATPVLLGGPVGMQRGFVLHSGDSAINEQWDSTLMVDGDIYLTGSKDILKALADSAGPERFLLTLGYSGWEASQLEQEIIDNQWLIAPADDSILFSTPIEKRFDAVLASLGIESVRLASVGGNA